MVLTVDDGGRRQTSFLGEQQQAGVELRSVKRRASASCSVRDERQTRRKRELKGCVSKYVDAVRYSASELSIDGRVRQQHFRAQGLQRESESV